MVIYLREPFFSNVLERRGAGDGEAEDEDVGLGVGEGAQAVVAFFADCVEQAEGVLGWRGSGGRGRLVREGVGIKGKGLRSEPTLWGS